MKREDALAALASEAPADRRTAARYLQFWAVPADIPLLREAQGRESVGWVSRAIEAALRRLGDRGSLAVELDDPIDAEIESSADAAAVARARVAKMVVHELEPIVGAVEYY